MKVSLSLVPLAVAGIAMALSGCATKNPLTGEKVSARTIYAESRAALNNLYANDPVARQLGERAKGVLVFPNILKGGFVVGGHGGNGTLFVPNQGATYYQTVGASYGLQAEASKYGYALFLMDDVAMGHLNSARGWEVGGTLDLVVVDSGVAGSLSTSTLQSGTYAFFFNQRGLMGGLSLQGTKVTRINPGP